MTDDSMICHDEDCQVADCGARAEHRTCDDCGAEGLVTDCGHEAQPRPLAADGRGRMVCDDCADSYATPAPTSGYGYGY